MSALFPPAPENVGLLLTYRCTAACDDCCFECSPRRREEMPLAVALEAVDQLAGMESVRGITLSGGECFLRYGDMLRILERARERGLATKIVTNGYWASSPEVARRKLRPLIAAGLGAIELSTDDYHARFVPLERVRNALEAAHELGLATHVIVIADREARGIDAILRELALSFTPEAAREFPVLPIGFARERIPAARLKLRDGMPGGRCLDTLRRPALTPRGELFACCAVAGFTPPLRIGGANGGDLKTQLAEAREDPLHMVLALDGPAGLAAIAARLGIFAPESPFVDECHLCHELLGNPAVAGALREHLSRNHLWYLLRRDYAESVQADGQDT